MNKVDHYAVVGIPLSRPEIVDFLLPPRSETRGIPLLTVGQRPTPPAEIDWLQRLLLTDRPTVTDLLAIDDPHGHLVAIQTDRLAPVESLTQPEFLTRNMGGWAANFFGVVGLPKKPWPADPVLNHLEILTDYGSQIRYLGADPALTKARLVEELGGDVPFVIEALLHLQTRRQAMAGQPLAYIDQIYEEIATGNCFATSERPCLPDLILYDELMGQLVRLELKRRAALADGRKQETESIKAWQQGHTETSGLRLILQGEYVIGRHRRSAILIAPELGVVIKQPAPEPLHDVALGFKEVEGQMENWPVTTNGGDLVTSRGRIRLTVEEDVVPRLNQVFNHNVRFSVVLGLSVEPFVVGQTVQDWVLADHSRLTPDLYETIVLHQQVCELLNIDNNDWHAPNFVRRDGDGKLVHIDWGAARPLEPAELTPEHQLARLNQIRNMAFSFKNHDLAERLTAIHTDLVADAARMERLRQRARTLIQT